MPYARPTLTDLRRQALDDLMNAPGGDGMALLRRAVGQSLAWALANQGNDLHEHLDWIARQAVPGTATGEYLEAWSALVGVYRKLAVQWAGTVSWPATGGAVVPNGSPLSANGNGYFTTADSVAGSGGLISAPVAAVLPGAAYSLAVGDTVTLTNSVAGVTGAGAVASVTRSGVDLEVDDDFRTRANIRWASPPQGGALIDYLEWALAVPGVTRAWVSPNSAGVGTVVIYTMWDIVDAAYGGFPQGTNGVATSESRGGVHAVGDQLTVANAIFPLRPVTALVYSAAPISSPVAFTIHTVVAVSTVLRPLVLAAIDGVFLAHATPLGAELETGLFAAAIAAIPGVPDFTITAPVAPIVTTLGYLPVRGAVTYA